jgi:predicted transcriptional regulator
VGTSSADEVDTKETLQKEMIARNSLALEAQVEERPLAKLQEELQEAANGELADESPASDSVSGRTENTSKPPEASGERHHRKALLKNDDVELQRVKRVSCSLRWSISVSEQSFSFWTLSINDSSKLTTAGLLIKETRRNSQAKHNLHHPYFTTFE